MYIVERGFVQFSLFFEKIGESIGLSRSEISFYTKKEIIQAMKQQTQVISKEEVQDRQEGFAMKWDDNYQIQVFTDDEKITEFKQTIKSQNKQEQSIEGTPACKGEVSGEAKIVYGVEDLEKVAEGDILIAITTHPDFVPAMQRAAGFVTDEGGLTSHAAIVSREMEKPCIVGTGNATEVLSDGDKVKVNTEDKTVKKLINSNE